MNKRFRACKDCNEYTNESHVRLKAAQRNLEVKAKANPSKKKTKKDVATLCFMTCVEELEKEEEAASMSAAKALASAQLKFPGRSFSINIFGASTGSLGYSVREEGRRNLTSRGYLDPPIVMPLNGAVGSSGDR